MSKVVKTDKKFKMVYILIGLIIFILGAFGITYANIYTKLSKIEDKKQEEEKILNEKRFKEVQGITNILLIGVDARDLKEHSRSDSMVLFTLDNKNKSLKLTSFTRDALFDIPKHGEQKLTHANAYGGRKMLIDTLEQNLNIDINHYAIVNFYTFKDIIDTIDGVEIDVKKEEIKELNRVIDLGKEEVFFDEDVKYVTKSGLQNLDSYQALAYSRMRESDTIFARDDRQRKMLKALAKKIETTSITKYPQIIDSILPYVETDMNPNEIIQIAFTAYKIGDFANIKQLEFPILEYSKALVKESKGWVVEWDKDECLKILDDYIYENIEYNGDNLGSNI